MPSHPKPAPWPYSRAFDIHIDELEAHPDTPGRHYTERQVDALARGLVRWGFFLPILLDDRNRILAGAARVAAAMRLGLARVPALRATEWPMHCVLAYTGADAALDTEGPWEHELLRAQLQALDEAQIELGAIGFSPTDLAFFQGEQDGDVLDPGPALNAELADPPISQPGDRWTIGDHVVLCGNPSQHAHTDSLFQGAHPELLFGHVPPADFHQHHVLAQVLDVQPAHVAYLWGRPELTPNILYAFSRARFEVRSYLISTHRERDPEFRDYRPIHELGIYAIRENERSLWTGDRLQNTSASPREGPDAPAHVIEVHRAAKAIANHAVPGAAVYDPFGFAGSTLIAAAKTRRRSFSMIVEPAHCDVAITRAAGVLRVDPIDEQGRAFSEAAAKRGIA